MTLWIDVSDLFGHAGAFRRPSGIQRVIFELGRALTETSTPKIGFIRHSSRLTYAEVPWPDIVALFSSLSDDATPPTVTPTRPLRLQLEAFRALLAIPASLRPPRRTAAAPLQPDDTLLILGAGWSDSGQVARLARLRQQTGLRIALLVYDIIPLMRPEWTDPSNAARFQSWFDGMLGITDRLLAISAWTARDIAIHRRRLGLPEIHIPLVRLGDGFSHAPPQTEAHHGIDGAFALIVSTIELRKNHAFLLDLWQALLARHGPAAIPKLVFAGRPGPLSHDLMQRLEASANLRGHIILLPSASDAEIAALYQGCSFTVFLSLYEGWGLPVAESLCFGKPCIASSATSVPEVGGDLVQIIDPRDLDAAIFCLEALLNDPAGLAAWQNAILRDFRPTPWLHTADTLLAGLA
jgi:glycosyltransferase involved in cell wall biosynthesis